MAKLLCSFTTLFKHSDNLDPAYAPSPVREFYPFNAPAFYPPADEFPVDRKHFSDVLNGVKLVWLYSKSLKNHLIRINRGFRHTLAFRFNSYFFLQDHEQCTVIA